MEERDHPLPTAFDQMRNNFPFPEIRPLQESALHLMADAYDEKKPFVVLDAPTGSGKSAVALAAALASSQRDVSSPGAHYLTSQNSLSRQIINDFGRLGVTQIKGRGTYNCTNHNTDCATGSISNGGLSCDGCPYRIAKNLYINTPVGVTNYTYFLTETMYSGELVPREYLILDEAHNIEREMLALLGITITQNRCDEVDAGNLPRFDSEQDSQVRLWLTGKFIPGLTNAVAELAEEIEEATRRGEQPTRMVKKRASLMQLGRNIGTYLEDDREPGWIAWTGTEGHLQIKPLSVAEYADRHLWSKGENFLLMSATILDVRTFRDTLGIPSDAYRSLAVPSEFPARNRRIIYWPVGSMGRKSIETALPRVAQRTTALLDKFADQKALIHTHSYRINNYLWEAMRGTPHYRRIVSHTSGPGSREDAIDMHCDALEPTVLMSPSVTEGLDLKDNLSRLQIITKVPYPYLDPYNRARMDRDPKWYQLQTAITLVQATGRSIRSKDDYALTVILDEDFGRFLSQNQDILPKWWVDSIEFK